ncbi:hypothetical protein RHMOL_Rhmol09G0101500 [Rhododendron molle]|uniref:Uncharacterized protein n=1 Tax=Rhododendron molle TaxID=49168 RepID=A0ACC0MBU8_RHOML|nr:hypothetical protein RHMOL_Rhmol09G0101500 [Rhododendron molle]
MVSKPQHTLEFSQTSTNPLILLQPPTDPHSPTVDTSGDGGNGSDRGGDQSKVGETETESARLVDQLTGEAPTGNGASISSGDGGHKGHAAEGDDGGYRHASVDTGHTPVESGSGGPRVRRLDFQSGVEGRVVTSLGLARVGASSSGGARGDDGSGQPPRDPVCGKTPMVEDESVPVERPEHIERVEFMPPVGSSSHEPTMSSDLAEFVGHDRLARLIREAPKVVVAVLTAREERLEEIARWNEQERLIREQEAAVRDQGELE